MKVAGMRVQMALFVFSVLFAAAMITRAVLYAQNSLHRNGHWISEKVSLEFGVIGGLKAFYSNTTLSEERLNLGAWHGYHRFFLAEPIDAEKVEFDFFPVPGSYFLVFVRRDPDGLTALRISAEPSIPAALLEIAPDGEYRAKTPFELPPTYRLNVPHHAEVEFLEGMVSLRIDGADVGDFPFAHSGPKQLGFGGSSQSTFIDNLRVKPRGSETWLSDSFRNTHNAAGIALLSLTALGFLGFLLIFFRGIAPGWVAYWNLFVGLFALAYFLYDWHYASHRYRSSPQVKGREGVRPKSDILAELRELYKTPKQAGTRRVLFVGSSQTAGSGARYLDDIFVRRIERRLNGEAGKRAGSPKYQCINAGLPSAKSADLLELYRDEWGVLDADLVVVNLGSNDGDASTLVQNVRELIAISRARGADVLLSLEPNDVLIDATVLREKHRALKELALQEKIDFVDPHEFLAEKRDSGLMWWDFVHLTSYGQRLFADFLYPHVSGILGKRKAHAPPVR